MFSYLKLNLCRCYRKYISLVMLNHIKSLGLIYPDLAISDPSHSGHASCPAHIHFEKLHGASSDIALYIC